MDDESCYAAIRLTQKGQSTQNVPLTYPRKKFDPRKITHAKLSVKRTHDPRKFAHDPRKVTNVPRPTTHDPRSFFNPRHPSNPRNLAHSTRQNTLVLQIDCSLDWKEQIKAVSTKVSRAVGFLKHAKSFLPKEALQTLYAGIVEPHFRYCCSVCCCAGSTEINQNYKNFKNVLLG